MSVSRKNLILFAMMLLTAGLAALLRPTQSLADQRPPITLQTMVPAAFGDWRVRVMNSAHIIDPQTKERLDKIYSETLTRTYINGDGYQIMLSIAYGKNQSDALQMHKPEICYPAQGFAVLDHQYGSVRLEGATVPATRLITELGQRREPVTYWTVVGDHVTKTGTDKKLTEMRYGFDNLIPDGMLVRVSSIDADSPRAFRVQNRFAEQMIAAIAPRNRTRFAGTMTSNEN